MDTLGQIQRTDALDRLISGDGSLVLVVDDDQLIREINCDALESVGFKVACAASGAEGLVLFESLRPSLVVLDVVMQDMDGYEVCRRLREMDVGNLVPVLMLTSLENEDSIQKAYAAGATDFLPKPVNGLLLGYRVCHILREHMAVNRLHRSELQQLTVFESIPDPLFIYDKNLIVLWANQAAYDCFGKEQEELLGQRAYGIWSNLEEEPADSKTRKCFDSGETFTGQKMAPDGTIWGVRIFPIRGRSGKIERVVEMAHNITDKIKVQEDSMRNSQLASLGELAAGVAHEINNPVGGVINYAQILKGHAGLSDSSLDLIKRIQREGERIAKIVGNLLGMSRIDNDDYGLLEIGSMLEDATSLFEVSLRKDGITMQVDLPEYLPPIRANRQQLQQVIINLLSNSRHALNLKGETSATRKVLEISAEETVFNGQSMIAIKTFDSGCGIPAHMIAQVMHPFFTTKPVGQGTGLGLSISHNIIREHGGLLIIDSEVNEYTRVTIMLPQRTGKNVS